jgi:PIN domain nuclease of toxin-antitoxin system
VRLLLDTHVMLWQLSGERSLGSRARERIAAAAELAFSVVSFAEIGVKAAAGKLVVPNDLHARVVSTGVRLLGLSADHGPAVGTRFRCTIAIRSIGCSSSRRSSKA